MDAVTLSEGETLVVDREELVYRQICGWMVAGGSILTHVFGPSPSDRGMPSFSRSSLITAQAARDWHDQHAPSASTGVRALSVDEVLEVRLLVIDDSGTPVPTAEHRAPGHCYVDFRDLTKPEIKSIRYVLYQRAMARGEIVTTATPPDGQLIN